MLEPTQAQIAPVAAAGEPPSDGVGHAHIATASFLASRVTPTAGFAIALAGGLALARVGQRAGARIGYGASLAAMLQNCALIGPARSGIPLTQALSAPLLGRMQARGIGLAGRLAACTTIRAVNQLVAMAFYVLVIVGGVDPYTDAYDGLARHVPLLPEGRTAALLLSGASMLAWTLFASTVQVLVYERGLKDWPATPGLADRSAAAPARPAARSRQRFDPRAVTACALLAFGALLLDTEWLLLGAVTAWLGAAWLLARGDREPVRPGLAFAAVLGTGALLVGLTGGADIELTLQRAVRAVLLVLVATWLRAAAGEAGLREVARRSLDRVRRIPPAREATTIFERLGASDELVSSGRALIEAVRHEERRPGPLSRAVLGWIAAEAGHFRAPPPSPRPALALRPSDGVLVLVAVLACATVAVPLF